MLLVLEQFFLYLDPYEFLARFQNQKLAVFFVYKLNLQ